MCRILERVKARGIAEGEAKGRAEGEAKGLAKGEAKLRKVVAKLIAAGKMTLTEIAEVSGLALREVRKLNAEMKKSAAL